MKITDPRILARDIARDFVGGREDKIEPWDMRLS